MRVHQVRIFQFLEPEVNRKEIKTNQDKDLRLLDYAGATASSPRGIEGGV